ncbi:fasciclin domain-containing protein, partial [Enterococcus faecium]
IVMIIKLNKMKAKFLAIAAIIVAGLFSTASAQKTVVDVAVGSKDHTTLVAAVKAAGLVETLQGTGPFTVFAPVNAAFGKL